MHAHVFTRALPAIDQARYVPDYDAPAQCYLEVLARHGIAGAVLVQPSFLGVHNEFLLACLRRYPEWFRGVVVVEPGRSVDLKVLGAPGVVGARLNLIGQDVPDLTAPAWRSFGVELARRGLHCEIQARAEQWARLGSALRGWPSTVVLDHLGLPGDAEEFDEQVLSLAGHDHVWVKVSAPYRSVSGAAETMLARLVDRVGVGRLVWGSDWPWTQHEHGRRYRDCISWPEKVLGAAAFRTISSDNAHRLLGWAPARREPDPNATGAS